MQIFILVSWNTHQVSWGAKNKTGVFQKTKRLHKQALHFSKCPPFAEEIFWLLMCPPTTLQKSLQVFMHLLTVIEKHHRQTWRSTPSGINWLRLKQPSVISELIEKRNSTMNNELQDGEDDKEVFLTKANVMIFC